MIAAAIKVVEQSATLEEAKTVNSISGAVTVVPPKSELARGSGETNGSKNSGDATVKARGASTS